MKFKIKVFPLLLAAVFLFSGCKIQSSEEYQNEKQAPPENPITVTLEIECQTLKDNLDKGKAAVQKIIPEDYVILEKTEFVVSDGSSVMDLLDSAAREKGLTVNKSSGYVKGINGLSEFSFGSSSGWFYYVNDEKPNLGVSAYSLKEGDEVRFAYTCVLD